MLKKGLGCDHRSNNKLPKQSDILTDNVLQSDADSNVAEMT